MCQVKISWPMCVAIFASRVFVISEWKTILASDVENAPEWMKQQQPDERERKKCLHARIYHQFKQPKRT